MKPGEIYYAETASGKRPAIIVSREELNRGRYAVAVLCTSAQFEIRSKLPNCVSFHGGEFGFTKDCVAQGETISLVLQSDLEGPIGILSDEVLRDLIRAIGNVLGADCEPA